MRVLYLAYDFPPATGGGVMRALKFASYLRDLECEPTVLTVARRTPVAGVAFPDGFVVHRARSIVPPEDQRAGRRHLDDGGRAGGPTGRRWLDRLRDRFLVPDTRVLWWPLARRRAIALHRDRPFDVILATAPPFSALLLGRELARRFRIPFVVDLRDPWVDAFASIRSAERPERVRRESSMERLVIGEADGIVVTAPALAAALADRYPEVGPDRFHVITNGFDLTDYADVTPRAFDHPALVYTGKLTSQYAPNALASTMCALREVGDTTAARARLHIVGDVDPASRDAFGRAGVSDAVTFHGSVSPLEARRFQLGADVLVLSLGPADARLRISGKVFEYLAAARPIVALVPPDGATAEIVRTSELGWVHDPADFRSAARTLAQLLAEGREGAVRRSSPPPSCYDRRALTADLARVLTDVCDPRHAASRRRRGEER